MGAFTNVGQAVSGKEMNPCRRALRDLMKELLTAIPEVLLAKDTPLLKAYNDAVNALAVDDVWEKQMQDYLNLQAQKSLYAQPNPIKTNIWLPWDRPSTTTGGTS